MTTSLQKIWNLDSAALNNVLDVEGKYNLIQDLNIRQKRGYVSILYYNKELIDQSDWHIIQHPNFYYLASNYDDLRNIIDIVENNVIDYETKEKLITHFEKLAGIYKILGDYFRSKSFDNATDILKNYTYEILNVQEFSQIKGIGSSIIEEIKNYIIHWKNTPRLVELERKHPNLLVLNEFQKVFGIGPVAAAKLYDEGYRNLNDLQNANLTSAQRIGLKYVHHIEEKIPKKEIENFERQIIPIIGQKNLNNTGFTWTIAGSYRRGASESGDIDLLIREGYDKNNVFIDLATIVNKLKENKYIVDELAYGCKKFMGIVKIDNKFRRIDIRAFEPDVWAYALLYNTGSKKFNIMTRVRASELGYILSEFGLWPVRNSMRGIMLAAKNENEIFEYLGMEFVSPNLR